MTCRVPPASGLELTGWLGEVMLSPRGIIFYHTYPVVVSGKAGWSFYILPRKMPLYSALIHFKSFSVDSVGFSR